MPSIFEPLKHAKKPHQELPSANASASLRQRIHEVAQQVIARRKVVSAATLLLLAAWLWLGNDPISPASQPVQQTLALPNATQLANQTIQEKPIAKPAPTSVITEPVKSTLEKSIQSAYSLNEVNQKAIELALSGQANKATIALEQALLNDPQAGVVFDNLRRLYAGLASQSYQLALEPNKPKPVTVELASADKGIQVQLEMPKITPEAIKVITPTTSSVANPVQAPPVTIAESAPLIAPSPSIAPIEPPKQPPALAVVEQKPLAAINPPAVAITKEPTAAQKEAAQRKASQQAIQQALKHWSDAWSKQDVKGYFASYAANYSPKSSTRKAWMDYRQERILAPKRIKVELSDINIVLIKPHIAKVSFVQSYSSDTLTSRNTKTLELELLNNTWLIISESGR